MAENEETVNEYLAVNEAQIISHSISDINRLAGTEHTEAIISIEENYYKNIQEQHTERHLPEAAPSKLQCLFLTTHCQKDIYQQYLKQQY